MAKNKPVAFESVWDAISSPEEAAMMRIKSDLMTEIIEHVKLRQYTQAEARIICKLSQSRMSDLMWGKLSKFSIDALIKILYCFGLKLQVTIVRN